MFLTFLLNFTFCYNLTRFNYIIFLLERNQDSYIHLDFLYLKLFIGKVSDGFFQGKKRAKNLLKYEILFWINYKYNFIKDETTSINNKQC